MTRAKLIEDNIYNIIHGGKGAKIDEPGVFPETEDEPKNSTRRANDMFWLRRYLGGVLKKPGE